MSEKKKDEVVSPLVAPHDNSKLDEAPHEIDVEAPASTDAEQREVNLPDLGGKID